MKTTATETINGATVNVHRSTKRGPMGGRVTEWTVVLPGAAPVLLADGHGTRSGAVAQAARGLALRAAL